MRAVVIYESMYGNTHHVADAIADGLREHGDAVAAPLARADEALAAGADLVVVGGPTHGWSMTRAGTRKGAMEQAERPGRILPVDPDAPGPGLREWLDGADRLPADAAAFDTRFHMPVALTGKASRLIARKLRRHGSLMVAPPESFFVTKRNTLEDHETERARAWGERLGARMEAVAPHHN